MWYGRPFDRDQSQAPRVACREEYQACGHRDTRRAYVDGVAAQFNGVFVAAFSLKRKAGLKPDPYKEMLRPQMAFQSSGAFLETVSGSARLGGPRRTSC